MGKDLVHGAWEERGRAGMLLQEGALCNIGAHRANLVEQYTRTKVQHSDRSFIQN